MSTHAHSDLYEDVLNRVRLLSLEEQLLLLEELARIIRQRVTQRPKHNVMEFRGIAKDFWQGVEVEKYIDEERNSWE